MGSWPFCVIVENKLDNLVQTAWEMSFVKTNTLRDI